MKRSTNGRTTIGERHSYGYGRFFDDWSERDLVAMIHRDRNHPSIVFWSIGNEIREQSPPRSTNGGAMAKRLSDIAHREDPTRPTVSACNSPEPHCETGFADALDVMGINYNIRPFYDSIKGRNLVASETASALSTRGEYGLYLDDDGKVQIKNELDHQCTSYDLDNPRWGHTAQTSLIALKSHPCDCRRIRLDRLRLHRRADALHLAFAVVVFRHHRFGRFPEGSVLYVPIAVDRQADGAPAAALELGAIRRQGNSGSGVHERRFGGVILERQIAGQREGSDLKELHYEWKVPFEPGTLKAVAKKGWQSRGDR